MRATRTCTEQIPTSMSSLYIPKWYSLTSMCPAFNFIRFCKLPRDDDSTSVCSVCRLDKHHAILGKDLKGSLEVLEWIPRDDRGVFPFSWFILWGVMLTGVKRKIHLDSRRLDSGDWRRGLWGSFLMFPHSVHLNLYHSRAKILHQDTWRPGKWVQKRESQVPVLGRQCTSY